MVGGEVKAVLLYGQMLIDGDERCSEARERRERLLANLAITDEEKEHLRSKYTEIKRFSRQKLDDLNQQLSLLHRLLYEMLSREEEWDAQAESIVHDLQTRLQPILAQTENLYEELFGLPANHPSIEGAQTQVGSLRQSVLGMRQLIYNLGDFTPEYQFEHCSLRRLVDDAVTLYRAEAERCGIDIQVVMEEPSTVRGSSPHLMQMISNLLHNAIKYSFRGAEDRYRYVEIPGSIRGRNYMVSFENYGIGILSGERERIFRRGVKGQLTSGEYRTGAGMGLSIVSEIVNRHGGRIAVYSDPTHGDAHVNRFVIHLPRY
jgi:signal transduction histidine kinase